VIIGGRRVTRLTDVSAFRCIRINSGSIVISIGRLSGVGLNEVCEVFAFYCEG